MNLVLLVLMMALTALNVDGENSTAEEEDQIKSLNEVKTLQVFGDLITIVAKNESKIDIKTCDYFDLYLQSHLIRIRSPVQEGTYFDIELNDLIPNIEIEGREKRDKRKGPIREILIPLLLALKYKSTVVLPFLMMMITFVAFKAFWAGMTGLVISKVVGLKVLLQSQNKQDKDYDEPEEDSHAFYNRNEDETDRSDKPIVIYLNSYNHRRKILKSHEKLLGERYFSWNSRRRKQDYGQEN